MTDHDAVADRLDIQHTIHLYAYGLDERRWEAWDDVFTADAVIDFRPMGGMVETPSQMSDRLGRPDPSWLFAQHPVSNIVISLHGDTASAYSDYGLQTGRRGDRPDEIVRVSGGGTYVDALVRTADGWRIRERVVRMKWKETKRVTDEVTR